MNSKEHKQVITNILKTEYEAYSAKILEALDFESDEGIKAADSFIMKFIRNSAKYADKALEEYEEELEARPSRHERAKRPYSTFDKMEFTDFFKGIISSTHEEVVDY